jgi:hypothetical protein
MGQAAGTSSQRQAQTELSRCLLWQLSDAAPLNDWVMIRSICRSHKAVDVQTLKIHGTGTGAAPVTSEESRGVSASAGEHRSEMHVRSANRVPQMQLILQTALLLAATSPPTNTSDEVVAPLTDEQLSRRDKGQASTEALLNNAYTQQQRLEEEQSSAGTGSGFLQALQVPKAARYC